MVTIHQISVTFSFVSGLVSLALLAVALSGYRRFRDPAMGFLAGAFTLFALKAFFVSFSLQFQLLAHSTLELVDSVGDLGTLLLIATPLILPQREPHDAPDA